MQTLLSANQSARTILVILQIGLASEKLYDSIFSGAQFLCDLRLKLFYYLFVAVVISSI